MKVLAITNNGTEFVYMPRSAHKVAQNKIDFVLDVLNKHRFMLTSDTQKWYAYEIDEYDSAYDYAQYQRFSVSKSGQVKRVWNN